MGARQACAGAPNLRGARGWGHGGSSGVRWCPEPPACTRLGAWGLVRRALVPPTSRAGRETSRVEVAGRRGPRAGADEGGEGDVGGGGGLDGASGGRADRDDGGDAGSPGLLQIGRATWRARGGKDG